MNYADRLRMAWSILAHGRAHVALNVTVVLKIDGYSRLCSEDLSAIREHVHMGVADALDEACASTIRAEEGYML